jgi:hypothetical protein
VGIGSPRIGPGESQRTDTYNNDGKRDQMGDAEAPKHTRVHPNELHAEWQCAGGDEVTTEHNFIVYAVPPRSQQHPTEDARADGFVKLRRMPRHRRGLKSLRKGDCPGQVGRPSVVVPDEETPEAPEQVTERERRGRGGQHRDLRQSLPLHDDGAGQHAARETTKPAHAASAEQEIHYALLTKALEHPQQLRACKSADYSGDGSVKGLGG